MSLWRSGFGHKVDHDVRLAEMDVLDFDAVEHGGQLRVLAEGEHQAVAVEDAEQFGARLFLDLAEGGAHHKLDAGAAAVGKEDVAAVDALHVDIKSHGPHKGHAVGYAQGVRAAEGQRDVFPGLVVNELSHFGIGEIELHGIIFFFFKITPNRKKNCIFAHSI